MSLWRRGLKSQKIYLVSCCIKFYLLCFELEFKNEMAIPHIQRVKYVTCIAQGQEIIC